jgi:hypothetical protein
MKSFQQWLKAQKGAFAALVILALSSAAAHSGPLLSDPVNDTFGVGPVQLDLVSVFAGFTATDLSLVVTFTTNIVPPSLFAANSVNGIIDFDIDQNPATGTASHVAPFGPPPGPTLGVEFFVDLTSEAFHPGEVEVLSEIFGPTQLVPISFGASNVSITIPLPLLGDDGLLNYALVVGTFDEPTDKAPNGSGFGTSVPLQVPEPMSLLLLVAGLACLSAKNRFSDHLPLGGQQAPVG